MNSQPKFRVSFCNSGGELDSRTADTPEEAAKALREMLDGVPFLYGGDVIRVTERED